MSWMPEGPRYLLELGCGLWAASAEVNPIYPTPGDPHRKSTKWHFLPCHGCVCAPSWQNWGLIPPRHSGWSSHHGPSWKTQTATCRRCQGRRELPEATVPAMRQRGGTGPWGHCWTSWIQPCLRAFAHCWTFQPFFCLSYFQFGSCHLGMNLECWL